jgi:hypothetical protein
MAVRIDDEGDARRFHVERANVDIALDQRNDSQPDRDGSGAKQRRLAGGFSAVQDKGIGLRAQSR